MKIADLWMAILPELKEFRVKLEAESVKAADSAGAKAGKRLGDGVGRGVQLGAKALAVGATALFGIATARAVELENAAARFRAETGATADEADRAGKAINRMAGDNLQNVEQIGDTMTKVHTDLGAVGDEAEELTQDFLTFARATNQDAGQAVSAFDDILDAWGLTAQDAQGIMDQLVASHQRYGGSIEGNQAALAALAPSLRATNMSLDDGIGFLNLFASSGVDAGSAAASLNRSIQELKPGQNLNDLVAELGAIEDPTKRAQRAVELFGRSGAKIANAIRPGTKSIADFVIRAEDVPDATEEAREALDSTFGARAEQLLKRFGSVVGDVLGQGGPVLTAIAGLASLSATFGLDKALKKVGGSAVVRGAARLAGAAIGLVFGASVFVAEKLAAIAASAIAAIPGGRGVLDAARGAGARAGGAFAAGWSGALLAGGALALPAIGLESIKDKVNEVGTSLFGIKDEWDRVMRAIRGEAPAQMEAAFVEPMTAIPALLDGPIAAVEDALAAGLAAAGDRAARDASNAVGAGFAEYFDEAKDGMADAVSLALEKAVTPEAKERARIAAVLAGQVVPKGFAGGIDTPTGRDDVARAWDALVDAFKNRQSATKEAAGLIGKLTGKELADRLGDADPEVRRAAENYRDTVIDRLKTMNLRSGIISKEAAQAIKNGLRSEDPEIAAWSARAYATVKKAAPTPAEMATWSRAAIDAYAQAMIERESRIQDAAARALSGAKRVFAASSPPGPESPLHLIDVWARRTGLAWVDNLVETIRDKAPKGVKAALAWVKAEFERAVKAYPGVGGLIGSFTPEGDRANLERYIRTTRRQLEATSDPEERLALYRKLVDYEARLASLAGDVATEEEKAAEALRLRVNELDRLLLTETDAKKRAAYLDELVASLAKIDQLLAPKEVPEARDAAQDARDLKRSQLEIAQLDLEHERSLLTATDELARQNRERVAAIDAQLDMIDRQIESLEYEERKTRLLREQAELYRAMGQEPSRGGGDRAGASGPYTSWEDAYARGGVDAAQQYLRDHPEAMGGMGAVQRPEMVNVGGQVDYQSALSGSGHRGPVYNIVVNNPAPEPASQSIRTRLQLAGAGLGTGG